MISLDGACLFQGMSSVICEQIIVDVTSCEWETCGFKNSDKSTEIYPDGSANVVMIDQIPLIGHILHKETPKLISIASDHLGASISSVTDGRILRYMPGDSVIKHKDSEGSLYQQRKITVVYFLTDYESHGLVGGGTSFDSFSVYPRQGNAVMFWSSREHEVPEIKHGIKYSLALFML